MGEPTFEIIVVAAQMNTRTRSRHTPTLKEQLPVSNKTFSQVFAPMIVSVLLASAAWGSETAGQAIDDTTVATRTKAALAENKAVSALDLNVEVYKGAVQLSGFVESEAAESAALATARQVEGAKQVLDAIVVHPGSRTMGQTVDDTAIQAKLKTGLASVEGLGKAMAINTGVRQGDVLLAGFVATEAAKSDAGKIAKGISGVKQVHNHIVVAD
jgi:hyperosmotically inducible protein